MSHTCSNCGHVEASTIKFQPIDSWHNSLSLGAREKLSGRTFKSGTGSHDGKAYRTLFVSAMGRTRLIEPSESEKTNLYNTEVLPVLEKINENFNVLGHLTLPQSIDLAVTDLSAPFAVFCFVTVEETPAFKSILGRLGLTRLTQEGSVDTVGDPQQTWFSR